jgi:hypothetical protein
MRPGGHCDVLDELKLREPSTPHEAAIFIEEIRTKKGYIDEGVRKEMKKMGEHSRITLESALKRGRDIEAAFTRRFDQRNHFVTKF